MAAHPALTRGKSLRLPLEDVQPGGVVPTVPVVVASSPSCGLSPIACPVQPSQKRSSAGFCFLQQQLVKNSLSMPAKSLLHAVLQQEHGVELQDYAVSRSGPTINSSSGNSSHAIPASWSPSHRRYTWATSGTASSSGKRHNPLQTIDSKMSDETILHLAQSSQLSFLGSVLRVVDETAPAALPAKSVIKSCCLAVQPATVPALLDCKDMVLAALHFCSQSWSSTNTVSTAAGVGVLPNLPLIEPLQENIGDLEKRSYRKVGDWVLSDIMIQVLALEDFFFDHCVHYKWLPRVAFCPAGLTAGRDLLLLKGSPPPQASGSVNGGKGKKGTASSGVSGATGLSVRKKKGLLATASSSIGASTSAVSTSAQIDETLLSSSQEDVAAAAAAVMDDPGPWTSMSDDLGADDGDPF